MQQRAKETLLVICLFLFLFVVLGGGLHLSSSGAFLAAMTGTPLVVHSFTVWSRKTSEIASSSNRVVTLHAREASADSANVVRR